MTEKIDKGRSVLNAADEIENPYGLVLSEAERNFIYGALNTLDHRTSSLLDARTGWRPQLRAAAQSFFELIVIGGVASIWHHDARMIFIGGILFVVLEKLNLLLTHETINEGDARRNREHEKERKQRRRYFEDMGTKDMSSEE